MSTRSRVAVRLKRAIRHMTPQHVARTQLTKRAINRFAEKAGLVYFGYVDQQDEDSRMVRGHTVSMTNIDSHYCIGTVQGYDVVLLLRNDVVKLRSGKQQRCHWLIYTIDLHSKVDVPPFYVGHQSHERVFEATFTWQKLIRLGHLAPYSAQFSTHYNVYANPSHVLDIERIITPPIADAIATHFQGASFEIQDNAVYLYVETENPREATLEKLLSNGIWLAGQIDAQVSEPASLDQPVAE